MEMLEYILPPFITGVVAIIVCLLNNRSVRIKEEVARQVRETEIKNIIDNLSSNLTMLQEMIDSFITESRSNDESLKQGMLNMIRDRFNQGYAFFMKIGKIDRNSKEAFSKLLDWYFEHGGNSFIGMEWERILELDEVPSREELFN